MAIVLGFVLVVAGAVVWIIAVRTADGRIGPNPLAGIRTRATMSSPEAWRAAHQAGLGPTRLGGGCSILAGVALVAWRPGDGATSAVVLVSAAAVLAFVLYGAWLGQRAAKSAAP